MGGWMGDEWKMVCYHVIWAVYRPGNGKFDVENIVPFICTQIVYGFAGLGSDNKTKSLFIVKWIFLFYLFIIYSVILLRELQSAFSPYCFFLTACISRQNGNRISMSYYCLISKNPFEFLHFLFDYTYLLVLVFYRLMTFLLLQGNLMTFLVKYFKCLCYSKLLMFGNQANLPFASQKEEWNTRRDL